MKKEIKILSELKIHTLFKKNDGYLRASEAFEEGIHPRYFYALRDRGEIELVTRGLFRLSTLPKLESPGLFTVGVKIPQGVVCLHSALEFHRLTSQKAPEISVALKKGSERPKIKEPRFRFFLISEPAFSTGVETRKKDGVHFQVYSPEKTLADCFKFRNKLGLELCLEALQTWWKMEEKNVNSLIEYAQACRVENVMRPYIALLNIQGKNSIV